MIGTILTYILFIYIFIRSIGYDNYREVVGIIAANFTVLLPQKTQILAIAMAQSLPPHLNHAWTIPLPHPYKLIRATIHPRSLIKSHQWPFPAQSINSMN